MKKLLVITLLSFFPFLLIGQDTGNTPAASGPENKKLKIAIPEFVYSNDPLSTAVVACPAFVEEFKKSSIYEIIEKDEYEKLLKENKLEDSSCRTASCLKKAAKLLSADKIILGMITKTMGRYTVEINVFDKDTNEIKNTQFFKVSSLGVLKTETVNIARKISAGIIESKKGESKFDEMIRKAEIKNVREPDSPAQIIKIGLGAFGGLSKLLTGYDSYVRRNYYGGLQVHLRPYEKNKPSDLSFGFAFDEIPLSLPEGTYGQTEDIASLTGYLHYNPFPVFIFHPYVGLGLGGYFDYITVDTPASGYMSSMYFFMGFNINAGAEWRINDFITLFGEVKYHFLWEPGKGGMFLANHLSVQGGVIFFLF
ncbi:MAG: hypothetical protein A2452_02665 [Candidatus Firestonebacteria bacterium RIFOXYC2_FULL_39_67]|nr:MAG: hypothetical protein A2536_02080 [Candidatus Firestonebacteria bacterium RIFOXYD2_FULL_39_29]OGF55362.1 MAG: hypothetical protein A2452_02665 [Candidatus Firestonebacteria bacterium RIFOXYC2_FULL_39_67]OGF57800.1 MAG: hypothetical protein A2497_03045 [Candidatus Firestonebacteria bacterium RifOxyC12_full_39_7]